MSSKQSCFKSVIKCDLRRSWWISALAALFIFMTTTSPLFTRDYGSYYYNRYDDALEFCENMFTNYAVGICVAAFVVLYLFSYLNKVNSVSFFHSLPAKRNTLMYAHLVSCVILVVFPMLVNSLISFFAVGKGVKASWVIISFLMYLLYSLVIMSLTLVVSLLTGVSIASAVFTGVLALLPLFIFSFISELCSAYLYGFAGYGNLMDVLIEYIYLSPEALMSWKFLIYVILAAVCFVFSFFLYNKRHLENYGEVIAFPGLKGLFKVLFGLCAGVLGYYYFEGFWNITSILTMLVFGTLGVVIAHMISNRSFSLKGVLKPILVTAALVLLLFVTFFFDLFGFEKRIPDADDIEYATISGLYYDDYTYVETDVYGSNRVRAYKKDPFIPNFRSEEEIGAFLKLHEYAVQHQSENDDWDDDFFTPSYLITDRRTFTFEYMLKNGKVMKRSYRLPVSEYNKLVYDIYNTDVYRKWKYPIIDGSEKIYKSVEIYDERTYIDGNGKMYVASSDEAKKIIEALKKDRENITYSRMQLKEYDTLITINLNYSTTYVGDDGKEYQVEQSDTYKIDKNDVNTWVLLNELDLFSADRKLTADDIMVVSVGVQNMYAYEDPYYDYYYEGDEYAKAEVYETSSYRIDKYYDGAGRYKEFTSKEDILTLFDLYINHTNEKIPDNTNYFELYLEIETHDNSMRGRTILIEFSELPEILSYLKELNLNK